MILRCHFSDVLCSSEAREGEGFYRRRAPAAVTERNRTLQGRPRAPGQSDCGPGSGTTRVLFAEMLARAPF